MFDPSDDSLPSTSHDSQTVPLQTQQSQVMKLKEWANKRGKSEDQLIRIRSSSSSSSSSVLNSNPSPNRHKSKHKVQERKRKSNPLPKIQSNQTLPRSETTSTLSKTIYISPPPPSPHLKDHHKRNASLNVDFITSSHFSTEEKRSSLSDTNSMKSGVSELMNPRQSDLDSLSFSSTLSVNDDNDHTQTPSTEGNPSISSTFSSNNNRHDEIESEIRPRTHSQPLKTLSLYLSPFSTSASLSKNFFHSQQNVSSSQEKSNNSFLSTTATTTTTKSFNVSSLHHKRNLSLNADFHSSITTASFEKPLVSVPTRTLSIPHSVPVKPHVLNTRKEGP
jgi:hypothetical protein